MPIYLFIDNRTGKVSEIVQKMDDKHEAFAEDGYKLDRIFTKPRASVDTQVDPNSSKDFIRRTAKNGMTIGEMMDLSAELSEKRSGTSGQDEIRHKAETSYSKRCGGKKHPHAKKQKTFFA